MKLALITGLVVLLSFEGVAGESLRNVLKSPQATLKLYKDFKEKKHIIHYKPEEERFRFGMFRSSAELVAGLNEDENEEAEYELNEFSVMTEEEKRSHLGLNNSMVQREAPSRVMRRRAKRGSANLPESVNWVAEGYVTPALDQGGCGSCWAFAVMVAFEGGYKKSTGILRKFSEQELLDCTYENSYAVVVYDGVEHEKVPYDGCWGGWPTDCYRYVLDNHRMASSADYKYHESDCRCEGHLKRNSMVAAKLTSYVLVPENEEAVIEALAENVLSIAFAVTDTFFQYKRGIWKDEKCKEKKGANHGVAMVGYTPTYVLVKNSWGDYWGDNGYIRFKRNHKHCYAWLDATYPIFEKTGVVDQLAVTAPDDYDPSLTDPHPDCEQFVNTRDDCDLNTCDEEDKDGQYWVDCKRTCNNCGHKGPHTGACPEGTKMCGGVCKHKHMC